MLNRDSHAANPEQTNTENDYKNAITVKSMAFALVAIILALIAHRHEIAGLGPGVPWDSIVPSMLPMLFLIACTFISKYLGRRFKIFYLNPGEIVMAYIACGFAIIVMSQLHIQSSIFNITWLRYQYALVPIIRGPKLIAESWSPLAFPSDEALIGLYQGSQSGVPWSDWILPIILWTTFFAAWVILFAVLGALFHYRWSAQERLSYGIIVPVLSIADSENLSSEKRYDIRNKLFLAGGIIPIIIRMFNILNEYFPAVPTIPITLDIGALLAGTYFAPMAFWPEFSVTFEPYAIGFGYIIPTDISLSVWLFYFVQRFMGLALHHLGVVNIMQGAIAHGLLMINGFGSALGLTIFLVWMARKNIVAFFRGKSLSTSSDYDVGNQRGLLIAALVSLVYILIVTRFIATLNWWLCIWYVLVLIVLAISWARARVESAVPFTRMGVLAGPFTTWLFGAERLGYQQGLSFCMLGGHSQWAIPSTTAWVMETLELGRLTKVKDKHKIIKMFVLVFIVTSLLAYIFFLPQWYDKGAGANIYGRVIDSWITPTSVANPIGFPALIFSFVITVLLGYLRSAFVWWPLSSIGYVVAANIDFSRYFTGSFLVAWLIKVLVQRYGGRNLFVKLMPFFLGMIVFDLSMGGLQAVIGIVAGFLR